MTSIPVVLSHHEAELAAQVGLRRHMEALRAGRADRHGAVRSTFAEGLAKHVNGAGGECAFAKARNLYWDGSVNTFKAGDVGEVQVRTRTHPDWELNVRTGDSDNAYFVLVVGEMPFYRVVGYIRGSDAKRPEWLQDYGGHGAAFFVPQPALFPFSGERVMA